jgi:hypothetical protein
MKNIKKYSEVFNDDGNPFLHIAWSAYIAAIEHHTLAGIEDVEEQTEYYKAVFQRWVNKQGLE